MFIFLKGSIMLHILLKEKEELEKSLKEIKKEIERLYKKQNKASCISYKNEKYLFALEFNKLCKSSRVSYVPGTTTTFGCFCIKNNVVQDKYLLKGHRKAYSLNTYFNVLKILLDQGILTRRRYNTCVSSLNSVLPTEVVETINPEYTLMVGEHHE